MTVQPDPEFDRAIAVTSTSEGRYAGELSGGFVVGGGVNGGYVLAVLGAAVRQAAGEHPDPFSVSAHYLSASRPGRCEVAVEPLRTGRGTSTYSATLSQDGQARVTALATYGDLGRLSDDVRTTAEPPVLPPREECIANDTAPPGMEIPLLGRSEMLVSPDFRRPSGRGEVAAWFRLREGREPDPLALLFAVDALPPATFDLGFYGWAPTVSLAVHVRARPAAGWLRLRHATRNVAGGWFEEDAEVWDSAGRLVAQARQLALMPRG
ncbi:thioesterase family protein [Nocardioides mangrovicus]|uniref:Thioesterase family protein n=1 Tax=Nocardioides mangrovicus TaxID=2478913 RepID=A0A3L8P837_9ACTN|nr:thioesterase family protein [Nocardioides mangrovicus]RLV50819.1 thioesterase family protein [Nocardioides mangrovicus]